MMLHPLALTDDCPEIPLHDFSQQDNVPGENDVSITTYVSSVDQVTNSFIVNIIKSPSSVFMTENYYIIISYNKIGQVIMVGIIWPNCFQDHNLMLLILSTKNKEKKSDQKHWKPFGNLFHPHQTGESLSDNLV